MSNNMRIWSSVDKTNPKDAKYVDQRGGFTAIDAYSQIRNATDLFGPLSIGWGFEYYTEMIDTLYIVHMQLWYVDPEDNGKAGLGVPDKRDTVKSIGAAEWKAKSGRLDKDAPKKALTDALTKALSYLGFNADVFLGKFDDNKYVQEMNREFADKEKPKTETRPASNPAPVQSTPPASKPKDGRHEFSDAIIKSCSLAHDPNMGMPVWFDEPIGIGENKDKAWGWLAAGSPGGRREKWLEWAIGTLEPKKSRSSELAVARAMATTTWRRQVADPNHKRTAPEGFSA